MDISKQDAEALTQALLDSTKLVGELMEWRPIETAPILPFVQKDWYKSGDSILVSISGRVSIARYAYTEKGKGRWIERGYGHVCKPSHWMPLPKPPEQ